MSGRSRHSSLVKRIAGCNALYTMSVASDLAAHRNCVSLYITLSRKAPKYLGTPLGLISFARPNASTGDCAAGVPVIIHNHVLGLIKELRIFQRLDCTFL